MMDEDDRRRPPTAAYLFGALLGWLLFAILAVAAIVATARVIAALVELWP